MTYLFNTLFFALNPLVIVESLVSSHHDIVMISFALTGVYLYFVKKKLLAILAIILSSQIKIPTIALIFPIILSFSIFKINISSQKFIQLTVLVMTGTLFYVLTRIEIQPWYFLWVLPFISLLKPNKYVVSLALGISLGLLLRYSVFLFYGNWEGIGVPIRNGLTIVTPVVFLTLAFIFDKFKPSFVGSK